MTERCVELRRTGNRALAKRDYVGAREAFEILISEQPDLWEGYVGLAKVLSRVGHYETIVEILEPALSRARSAMMVKALADAFRVLGNRGDANAVKSAIKYYEEFRTEREDAVSLYYLGELYREHENNYEKALECLKASWALDSGSQAVRSAAMQCAGKLGLTKEEVGL